MIVINFKKLLHNGAEEHDPAGTVEKNRDCNKQHQWLKKKKTNPKANYLLSICDVLDITPEQLLTGKGIDPEYKDADMDYEVTRSNIKILKQIHSLGDDQYKRLMAYMKALQKLEQMHVTYMGWKYVY